VRFITEFVAELRAVGIGVSMVEAADAAEALRHVDVTDRTQVRHTLAATLVKAERHLDAFDAAFEAFFSLAPPTPGSADADDRDREDAEAVAAAGRGSGGGGGEGTEGELTAALIAALTAGDDALLQAVIRRAVTRFAGMEPGRPVGGSYYLYRVVRSLDLDEVRRRLADGPVDTAESPLGRRFRIEEIERELEQVRDAIRREITRRLVADRGRPAVARTMRRPLAEDIDLSTATREELARIEATVRPLARKLATRLARRRRLGAQGRLDVRRSVRRSLSTGGVLVDPQFRRPRPGRPELVLLTDVSGSVATFARFTMQLIHAISSQLSRVRSFAFIDAVDEVTGFFGPGVDVVRATERVGAEARVVWVDGHSNYGHAFGQFVDQHLDAVSPTATVIIAGDARSNYHEPNTESFRRLAARCRAVYWLNPEDHRYWDTGDSVIGVYAQWCDAVYEVRNLRQLERFVERVALPSGFAPFRHE
jgi:uncharacterized protein